MLRLDYDGTLAENRVLPAEVPVAITEAVLSHLVVILVIGRTLDDLRSVLVDVTRSLQGTLQPVTNLHDYVAVPVPCCL